MNRHHVVCRIAAASWPRRWPCFLVRPRRAAQEPPAPVLQAEQARIAAIDAGHENGRGRVRTGRQWRRFGRRHHAGRFRALEFPRRETGRPVHAVRHGRRTTCTTP